MPIKFPQFLRRYDLRLLPVSVDDIIPGAVVTKKRGYVYQGHLNQLLPGKPGKFWKVEINPANIAYGTVERTLSLKGKSSLDQMGVRVEGGLGRAKSVAFSISAVHARTFVNGPGHASMFTLTPLLQQLRKTNRKAWRMVNDRWVVLETYHASEATVTFGTSGNVDLKAEVNAAGGVNVQGDGGIRWTGKRSFKITENNAVPFGFRGWKSLIRIELTTDIEATPERCFDLSLNIDLHQRSMRRWKERAVAGTVSGLIGPGEEVTFRVCFFGIWLEHTARITAFDRPRHFRDTMIRGMFERFRHDHSFERSDHGTRMVDVLEFRSRFGPIGKVLDRLVVKRSLVYLLRCRNEQIKLEAENGRGR